MADRKLKSAAGRFLRNDLLKAASQRIWGSFSPLNVNIVATGGGADSNIHANGSTIAAGNTVNPAADNAITLEASKSTFEQVGANSSSGASIGVGFDMGAQNGFTLELGVSQGRGNSNQNDTKRPRERRQREACCDDAQANTARPIH